jgi:DNA gyrase/topoisomerase IV subunit B
MPPKRDKKQYQRLDPIQHCLRRADMYVGSLRPKRTLEYVASTTEDGFSIVQEEISFAPALLRIFIEALSNAVDNVERSREAGIPCTRIKVTLDRETGETSIWNDGYVVPIDIHPEENCYIHSMIFGQLLTGSNYDDEEERIIAGRNGIGIKAVSIFSNEFQVEGVDPSVGKIFKQKWTQNMQKTSEPSVKASSRKTGYTKVTWIPDFKRFGITRYSLDIIKLYTRHVIDAAMLSGVSVSLNGSDVPVKNLNHYAALYPSLTEERLLIQSESAKVLVMPNNGQTPGGECISFVNGMYTKLGGQHVDAWSEALFRPIVTKFNSRGGAKGAKSNQKININDVKQFFRLFVLVTVVRPEFNGQNKEQLESPSIEAQVKRTQINTICKWSVMERIEDIIRAKEMVILKKIEKKKKVIVPGLDAANNAGGKHATQCSLFVCEGLSAKTYIVAGIGGELYGKSGRDWFGILPVTGKLLNVRNATPTVIAANKVIVGLIQALGLTQGLDYRQDKNFKTLNYGKLILTCDADCIKHNDNTIDITSVENLSKKWVDNIAVLDDIEIWSKGGWTKVLGLTRKETTKKMLEISAYCGIIHCTEDHKMILEDGSETTARNLEPGDRLLRTTSPTIHKGYNESTDMSLDEAWIYGLFFAKGTCESTTSQWSISIGNRELLEKTQSFLKRLYPNYTYSSCLAPDTLTYQLVLNDGEKVKNHIEMWRFCFYDSILGQNKKIPSSILNAAREIHQSFFEGYCDGYRYLQQEQNVPVFDISGQIGAHGLYFIAERLGYSPTIHKKPDKNDVYTMTITKGCCPGIVKSVSEVDYDHPYVYDIETENHMLNAGIGGLVVHNCDGLHIEALVMNVIHALFPTLLERSEPFIISMKTPIAR